MDKYIKILADGVEIVYAKYDGEKYPYFFMLITPIFRTGKVFSTPKEFKEELEALIPVKEKYYTVRRGVGDEKEQEQVLGADLAEAVLNYLGV